MRAKRNPVFYADQLEVFLSEEPERLERIRTDPGSLDLLTWNLFMSLDTHSDRPYYGYRMQMFGGAGVQAPVRTSPWTGRFREPILRPSPGYVEVVHQRAQGAGGDPASLEVYQAPIEAGVRLESPDVLCLIEPVLATPPRGAGGRDRLVELVDAGLDHARRLSKQLAVAVIYPHGSEAATELSARVRELQDPGRLAAALPHREKLPGVALREVEWRELIRVWETERTYLDLGLQPVGRFLKLLSERGLRTG